MPFDAVEDGSALFFGGFGVRLFVHFSCKITVDNGNGSAMVTGKQFGIADGKNSAVELSERSLNLVRRH